MSLALIARRCCETLDQTEPRPVQRERERCGKYSSSTLTRRGTTDNPHVGSRTSTITTRALKARSKTYPHLFTPLAEAPRDDRSYDPNAATPHWGIFDAVNPDGRATEFPILPNPSDTGLPSVSRSPRHIGDAVMTDGRATEILPNPSGTSLPSDSKSPQHVVDAVNTDGRETEIPLLPNPSDISLPSDSNSPRHIVDAVITHGRETEIPLLPNPSSTNAPCDGNSPKHIAVTVIPDGRTTEFPLQPNPSDTSSRSDSNSPRHIVDAVITDGLGTEFPLLPNLSDSSSPSDSNPPRGSNAPDIYDHPVVMQRWSAYAISGLQSQSDDDILESADDSVDVNDVDGHSRDRMKEDKAFVVDAGDADSYSLDRTKEDKAIVVDVGGSWGEQRLSVVARGTKQSINIGAFVNDYTGLFPARANAENRTIGSICDVSARREGTDAGRIQLKESGEEGTVVGAHHLRRHDSRPRSPYRRDLAHSWSRSSATKMSQASSTVNSQTFLLRRPPQVCQPPFRETCVHAPDVLGWPGAPSRSLPCFSQYQMAAKAMAANVEPPDLGANAAVDARGAAVSVTPLCDRAANAALDGRNTMLSVEPSSDRAPSAALDGCNTMLSVEPSSDRAPNAALDGRNTMLSVEPSSDRAPNAALDGRNTMLPVEPSSDRAPNAALDGRNTMLSVEPSSDRAASLLGRDTINDDALSSQWRLAAPAICRSDSPLQDQAEVVHTTAQKKDPSTLHDNVDSRTQKGVRATLPSDMSWHKSELFAGVTRPRVHYARAPAPSSPLLPSNVTWRQSSAYRSRHSHVQCSESNSVIPEDGTALCANMPQEFTGRRSAADCPQRNRNAEPNCVTAPRPAGLPSSCPESLASNNMTAAAQWATSGVPHSLPARDDLPYAGRASSLQSPPKARATTVPAADSPRNVRAVIPPYGVSLAPRAVDTPPNATARTTPHPLTPPSTVIPPYAVSAATNQDRLPLSAAP